VPRQPVRRGAIERGTQHEIDEADKEKDLRRIDLMFMTSVDDASITRRTAITLASAQCAPNQEMFL